MEEALYSGDIKDPKRTGIHPRQIGANPRIHRKKQTEQKRIKNALHSEIAYYQYTGEENEKTATKIFRKSERLKKISIRPSMTELLPLIMHLKQSQKKLHRRN